MKKYFFFLFLCVTSRINSQIIVPNFCELIHQISNQKDILITTNLKSPVNETCQDFSINDKILTDEEVYQKLNKKERKLVKINLTSIDSSSYQVKISYYNAWKKGKKINLAIIGSSVMTYCYSCQNKKFIFCKEDNSFH
jgi:hypothetical protein